ncbi:MAG TPA: hypothetical protein VIH95_02620 [Acidimicrobiales bacterium]
MTAAAGLLLAGWGVAACGDSSASPTTSTVTTSAAGTPIGWLRTVAEPLNHKLNADQTAIDAASSSGTSGTSGKTAAFFTKLGQACHQMLSDAHQAQALSPAPSAKLDSAWRAMADTTAAYANHCVTLSTSHSSADFTKWDNSLSAMNAASVGFNAAVAVVRGTSAGGSGTTTTTTVGAAG